MRKLELDLELTQGPVLGLKIPLGLEPMRSLELDQESAKANNVETLQDNQPFK